MMMRAGFVAFGVATCCSLLCLARRTSAGR
jgi:hypothetical protein